MATDTRDSGDASGVNYSAANINTLLTQFEAGDIITKSAIDTLLDYYTDMTTHTHEVTDFTTKATFGNTGSNSSTTENTDNPTIAAVPADPGTNSTITASKHNEIRNAVNNVRTHVHNWNDA